MLAQTFSGRRGMGGMEVEEVWDTWEDVNNYEFVCMHLQC